MPDFTQEIGKMGHLSDYLKRTENILLARTEKPALPITSMTDINKKIWGLPKGKMTVIGARTSQGKTSFVLQLALDILMSGKSVHYFSFEMTKEQIIERMFCNMYKIDNYALLSGKFTDYYSLWDDFKDYLSNLRVVMSNDFGQSWKDIERFLDSLTVKPDVIIVDYIQAVARASVEGKGFIDEYIRQFREICIKQNVAGVIVSQLNRQTVADGKTVPNLHNLKGSGFIEELCDLCLLLEWTGKKEQKNDFVVNVAKNRNGRTGIIKVKYEPEFYKFSDFPKEELTEEEKYQKFSKVGK